MKRIMGSLVALAAVVMVAALSGGETQRAAADEFRFDAAKLKDKTLWTPVNLQPYYISSALDGLCRAPTPANYEMVRKANPHVNSAITVYVNNVGRQAMFAKELGRFPEGSIIVKEKIGTTSEGRVPVLYTLMIKRESGFNPAVGDWEFAVVSGNGTQLEARGKLENCQACHVAKGKSDFVFRPYFKSE